MSAEAPRTELTELIAEIEALFPADTIAAATLRPALAALTRALAADDRDAAWSALDLLEDLLEARMHEAGWPQPEGGSR